MKVHYPKLYNMAHFFSLNVFTASKGSNNYILFDSVPKCQQVEIYWCFVPTQIFTSSYPVNVHGAKI